jgi:hypothetical protein
MVGLTYLAGNIMLPDYFAFNKFNPALLMDQSNVMSTVLLLSPMIAGAGGIALVSNAKRMKLFSGLNLKVGLHKKTEQAGRQQQTEQAPAPAAEAQPQVMEQAIAAAPEPVPQAAPAINMEETMTMIEEMVSKKVGEVVSDVTAMKNEVKVFSEDITHIKDGMQNLTLSVESSLTDLKAFQAEMVNPLNFMRKYFESMDIKSLSDPMKPLPQVEIKASAHEEAPVLPQKDTVQEKPDTSNEVVQKINVPAQRPAVEDDNDEEDEEPAVQGEPQAQLHATLQHILPQLIEEQQGEKTMVNEKQDNGNGHTSKIFMGSLTLGKLMSMVSILEKLLRDMGPDELEALIEQYRQFGLKTEDEAAVYNVVGMLKDFGMSADEVMVRLYRLGQVMGIKDAQADLEYAKLQARKARKEPIPAKETFGRKALDG